MASADAKKKKKWFKGFFMDAELVMKLVIVKLIKIINEFVSYLNIKLILIFIG